MGEIKRHNKLEGNRTVHINVTGYVQTPGSNNKSYWTKESKDLCKLYWREGKGDRNNTGWKESGWICRQGTRCSYSSAGFTGGHVCGVFHHDGHVSEDMLSLFSWPWGGSNKLLHELLCSSCWHLTLCTDSLVCDNSGQKYGHLHLTRKKCQESDPCSILISLLLSLSPSLPLSLSLNLV